VGALSLVALIVQTASRAGFAALFLGLSVFLLPGGGARRKFVAILQAIMILGGALYMVMKSTVLEGRLGSFYHAGDVTRTHIYAAAWEMVKRKPIAGWGPVIAQRQLGGWVASKTGIRDAHNLLLTLLLEVGIIGALPFLGGLFVVLLSTWSWRSGPLGLVPLAMMAVVLATNVAHTSLVWKSMWFVLAIGMVPLAANRKKRQQMTPRTVGTPGVVGRR
jgi:O-antigen ligase